MADESMIERVARAICVANGEDPDKEYPYVDPKSKVLSSFGVYQPQWFQVLPIARAAIAAMRGPTEAMIKAAIVAGMPFHQFLYSWERAIDAAQDSPKEIATAEAKNSQNKAIHTCEN